MNGCGRIAATARLLTAGWINCTTLAEAKRCAGRCRSEPRSQGRRPASLIAWPLNLPVAILERRPLRAHFRALVGMATAARALGDGAPVPDIARLQHPCNRSATARREAARMSDSTAQRLRLTAAGARRHS